MPHAQHVAMPWFGISMDTTQDNSVDAEEEKTVQDSAFTQEEWSQARRDAEKIDWGQSRQEVEQMEAELNARIYKALHSGELLKAPSSAEEEKQIKDQAMRQSEAEWKAYRSRKEELEREQKSAMLMDANFTASGHGKLVPNTGHGYNYGTHAFTQTVKEVTVTVPVPQGTRSNMLDITISRQGLSVGFKGQDPIVKGDLFGEVKLDDCTWEVSDGKLVEVLLVKSEVHGIRWWDRVFTTDRQIDTDKIMNENLKASDFNPETRQNLEKMIHDRQQKNYNAFFKDQEKYYKMMNELGMRPAERRVG
eukprot:gnl/MRDRNA2_/MRDRNA2_77933_c0_seq2.p1 gnl/MRDRNA2_/MRDRNA2_77933_c0~~gnl/MRDRNA2_/MRDRNA2_77933_c0_seq2.p1  ORF type:complete len:306 (+),score=82.40 gnl/MRDRNA2_/MRDRNA2_77933_c0_seq2:360-1277(+)